MAKGKPPATQASEHRDTERGRFVQDAIKQVGVGGSSTIIVPKPHPATTAAAANSLQPAMKSLASSQQVLLKDFDQNKFISGLSNDYKSIKGGLNFKSEEGRRRK